MNKKLLLAFVLLFLIILGITSLLLGTTKSPKLLFLFAPTPTPISGGRALPKINTSNPISVIATDPEDNTSNIPVDKVIHITFNRPIDPQEVVFHANPPFAFAQSSADTILTIKPESSLQQATSYSFFVSFLSFPPSVSYSFTTTSPNPSVTPVQGDTVPQHENQQSKITDTDVFLSNYTPYETADFRVESALTPYPTDHFFFNVTLNKNNPSAKQLFVSWLHSLSLTDTQIASLDIRYL